jgi:signal transduction histidine kinase
VVLQHELATQSEDLEELVRELAVRKRDLETACASLEVARDQAERAARAKSVFLNLVSHELRTPLTVLQTYLQLLARGTAGTLAPPQHRIVEKLLASSRRLFRLIEALLEQARIQSGRLTTEPVPVDLAGVVAEVVEEAREQAEEKSLALSVSVPPELPPVVSDARLLRLILSNLVTNAVKFTSDGEVEVAVAYGGGAHRITVRDSGPGIPRERQRTVFEPFEQMEDVRHKHTPGVGLGLTLVKELVDALGGTVELRSAVGAGSTFVVVLPSVAQNARETA